MLLCKKRGRDCFYDWVFTLFYLGLSSLFSDGLLLRTKSGFEVEVLKTSVGVVLGWGIAYSITSEVVCSSTSFVNCFCGPDSLAKGLCCLYLKPIM